MRDEKLLIVVLPAFNEAEVIEQVLNGLKDELKKFINFKTEVVVVDDGSTDRTEIIARQKGALVFAHLVNRGLGASLTTGMEYAKQKGADILVTMDADGQHDPRDISNLIKPVINNQADVVIGSRFLGKAIALGCLRKIILKASNLITWIFFGVYSSDSQSGFRAFSKKAIQKLKLRTQRMEVSSELFSQIESNNLQFKEVPIKVIYTAYSKKKGQSNLNAVKILVKLILRLAR